MHKTLTAAIGLILLSAVVAKAIPVSFEMVGEFITVATELTPTLNETKQFRINFTYDTDVADSSSNPEIGVYIGAVSSFQVAVLDGSYSGRYDFATIYTVNAASSDNMLSFSSGVGGLSNFPAINGYSGGDFNLSFTYAGSGFLNGDSLPAALDLDDTRSFARHLAIGFGDPNAPLLAVGEIVGVTTRATDSVPDVFSTVTVLGLVFAALCAATRYLRIGTPSWWAVCSRRSSHGLCTAEIRQPTRGMVRAF